MKRNFLFLMSLVLGLFVYAGILSAETTYRTKNQTLIQNQNQNQNQNQKQNQNQIQNRRYKQNMMCLAGLNVTDATKLVGDVSPPQTFDGLQISTTEGLVTVYGLGPVWFWLDQGVDRPEIGDKVSLEVKKVDFNGTDRFILMELTYITDAGALEDFIQLRNPTTNCPLWKPMPK